MQREVIIVPKDKDFLEFIREKFGGKKVGVWFFIDKRTIDALASKEGVPYCDSTGKLHIPYGNIIVDGYGFEKYSWNRINFIDSNEVIYEAAMDPKEIFFLSIQ